KLRHIVRRRFGVEIGFAGARGELMAGAADAAGCAREALRAVGDEARGSVAYACGAPGGRGEIAAPIGRDGAAPGCAVAAAPSRRDDGFLAELIELSAEEMVTFSTEMQRERRAAGGRELATRYAYEGIVGRSRGMQELYHLLDKVIDSDSTVLIQGENGTGK